MKIIYDGLRRVAGRSSGGDSCGHIQVGEAGGGGCKATLAAARGEVEEKSPSLEEAQGRRIFTLTASLPHFGYYLMDYDSRKTRNFARLGKSRKFSQPEPMQKQKVLMMDLAQHRNGNEKCVLCLRGLGERDIRNTNRRRGCGEGDVMRPL